MAGYVLDPNKVEGKHGCRRVQKQQQALLFLKRWVFIIDKSPVKVIRNEIYQVFGFPQSTNWKLTGKITLYSNFMYVKNTYVRYVFMTHTFFFMIYNHKLNSIVKIKC